jgi:hypothetical protein
MTTSMPFPDPLEAAVLAAKKASTSAMATAVAMTAAARAAEEAAALAWASLESAESALAVSISNKALIPSDPSVSSTSYHPKASCSSRGAVAMTTRTTGIERYSAQWAAIASAKESARVAGAAAHETAAGMKTIVQALRATTLLAETAEAEANEAAEAAIVWALMAL